jgi:hypothetical protein
MVSILLSVVLATGQAPAASPPPLTEDQLTRLRELVRGTQATAERLRQELADHERQLAEKYAQFDLDEAGAKRLQNGIVERQKELLVNYHRLQVELRKVVGPERFGQLKQRLDNVLRPKAKTEGPAEPARSRSASESQPR